MQAILTFIHVIIVVALIVLVLIQQGKGADMGAAFGSGGANTVFGSQGSGSFLSKLTACLVAAFFITSLSLGYVISHKKQGQLLLDQTTTSQPAKPSKAH